MLNKYKSFYKSQDLASRRRVLFSVFTLIVIVSLVTILSAFSDDILPRLINYFRELVDKWGIWAPVIYYIAYVLISLTGFSTTILSLVAVSIFSPITAYFVIVLALSTAAFAAFEISRFAKIKIVLNKDVKKRNLIESLKGRIESSAERRGFRTILLLRLARIPYTAVSYASGYVNDLKLSSFLAATLIANLIAAFIFVKIGTAGFKYIALFSFAMILVTNHNTILNFLRKLKLKFN